MPYLHTTTRVLPEFLNVSESVGPNAPNLPEDVKFVQEALSSIYICRHVKVHKNLGGYWAKPKRSLEITGKCDLATRQWILKFQIDVSNHVGTDILIDGRVDPAANPSSTIVYLNRVLQLNYPEQHQALLSECKPSASRALKRMVTQTLRIPRLAL